MMRSKLNKQKKVKANAAAGNLNKTGKVCGNDVLSFLECREWAKKLDLRFRLWKDAYLSPAPKGCLLDVKDVRTFQRKGFRPEWDKVYYNNAADETDKLCTPVCKVHDLNHSQIFANARDMKKATAEKSKNYDAFAIEQAKRVKAIAKRGNLNKTGKVCGNDVLNFLECREWAIRLDLHFGLWKDEYESPAPKGCLLDVEDVKKFKYYGFLPVNVTEMDRVYYNTSETDKTDEHSIPVCKVHDLDQDCILN